MDCKKQDYSKSEYLSNDGEAELSQASHSFGSVAHVGYNRCRSRLQLLPCHEGSILMSSSVSWCSCESNPPVFTHSCQALATNCRSHSIKSERVGQGGGARLKGEGDQPQDQPHGRRVSLRCLFSAVINGQIMSKERFRGVGTYYIYISNLLHHKLFKRSSLRWSIFQLYNLHFICHKHNRRCLMSALCH